jgi:hypothetical protein
MVMPEAIDTDLFDPDATDVLPPGALASGNPEFGDAFDFFF